MIGAIVATLTSMDRQYTSYEQFLWENGLQYTHCYDLIARRTLKAKEEQMQTTDTTSAASAPYVAWLRQYDGL